MIYLHKNKDICFSVTSAILKKEASSSLLISLFRREICRRGWECFRTAGKMPASDILDVRTRSPCDYRHSVHSQILVTISVFGDGGVRYVLLPCAPHLSFRPEVIALMFPRAAKGLETTSLLTAFVVAAVLSESLPVLHLSLSRIRIHTRSCISSAIFPPLYLCDRAHSRWIENGKPGAETWKNAMKKVTQ